MVQPARHGDSHLETSLKVMNQIVQQKVLHVWCGRERMAPPTHRHHCRQHTIVVGPVPQPSCEWIVAFPCLQMFAKSYDEFSVILCGSEGKTSACCVQAGTSTAHTSSPLPSPFTSSLPYFSPETRNGREISPVQLQQWEGTCWPKPRRAGRRWAHSKCSSSLTPLPGTVTTDCDRSRN